jgi:hypothetical protein
LTAEDSVVLFNTGSGLKYLDVLDSTLSSLKPLAAKSEPAAKPAPRHIAGIIGPY